MPFADGTHNSTPALLTSYFTRVKIQTGCALLILKLSILMREGSSERERESENDSAKWIGKGRLKAAANTPEDRRQQVVRSWQKLLLILFTILHISFTNSSPISRLVRTVLIKSYIITANFLGEGKHS